MKTPTQRLLSIALSAACLLAASDAFAARPEHRAGIGAPLGVGGKYNSRDSSGDVTVDYDGEDANMQVSFGAFIQYEYSPIKYVSIGARPTFLAYQAKGEADAEIARNFAVNFDLMLQLQLPFGTDNILYVAIPVGPALTIPSKDYADALGGIGLDFDPGLAWNLSALLGVELQGGGSDPGLFIEAGYAYQRTNYHVTGGLGGLFEVDENVKGAFWQIGLSAGITFALDG